MGSQRGSAVSTAGLSSALVIAAVGCGFAPAPKTHASTHHPIKSISAQTKSRGTSPSGDTSQSGSPASANAPLTNRPVNGCDPTQSIWGGFCVSTLPLVTESSAGLTEWSGIAAGATVEVKGSTLVNAATLKPYVQSVGIAGPHGFHETLPVHSNGGFDAEVTFPKAGTYQMGVIQAGVVQQGVTFGVFYVPHPQVSTTITSVFSESHRTLPNDIVLVFPYGTTPTVPVLFTDVAGQPATSVTLQIPGGPAITTNASGVAEVPLSPGGPFPGMIPLYGALFALPYYTGHVSDGAVTSWPRPPDANGAPTPPDTIVEGAGRFYEATGALSLLDPFGETTLNFDSATGILTISEDGTTVTVTSEGSVDVSNQVCRPPSGCVAGPTAVIGQVHPLESGGHLYLDVPDLLTVLNGYAWASLTADGTLMVADFNYP